MSKTGVHRVTPVISFLLLVFLLGGCTSSQTNFKREYRRVWKETVQSEAWKRSLQKEGLFASNDSREFFSSTEDPGVLQGDSYLETGMGASFDEKYASLISRAYLKIIAEAEEADARIEQDYLRLSSHKAELENRNNKDYKKNLELARKRYIAHREILDGLKSWNAFSEYGSDDLDFFKEEQADAAYKMFLDGESEENIIDFLIYKLADLYQYEE